LEKITRFGPFPITLGIAIISIILYSINPPFLNLMELKAYDLRFRSRGVEKPGKEIVIVRIDEESIRKLGRWPWSREYWAVLFDFLTEWGARVIGVDVIFAETEGSQDTKIARLKDEMGTLGIEDPRVFELLEAEIGRADSRLAQSMSKSGSVVLGYFFLTSREELNGLRETSPFDDAGSLLPQPLPVVFAPKGAKDVPLWEGHYMKSNIERVGAKANGLGFMNVVPDPDGTVRWVPLVMEFQGKYYPSLALQILREHLKERQPPILRMADSGVEEVRLGETPIPTDERGQLLVRYRGGRSTFPSYAFSRVISGEVPQEEFRDKIVLVGATALGLYDARTTPFDREVPGVEIHATVIDNILHRDFVLRPVWIRGVNILIILLMAFIPGLLLAKLHAMKGAFISVGLLLLYAVANRYLLVNQGIWINFVSPGMAFLGVFGAVTVYRYVTEEREKKKIRSTFQYFVSPGVVNEILRDPAKLKLGGERKVLSVLFSDIRDFTYLSETLSPDTLTKLLNLYLTPMTEIVFRYQGTLDKYMGDALMAIFGAPLDQEDHAEKACHAALDMLKALEDLQKSWEIDGVPKVSMGIGINSGLMSVGNMGSDMLFDYSVVGDHVNLGSRLEKLNREYGTSIILSEYTYGYVKDLFACRELDIVRVRGRTEPVRIFELLGREDPFHEWPTFKTVFENGLRAYRSQRWDEGIGEFEKTLRIRPGDGPTKLYLRRCRLLQRKSPSSEWDGIYQMRE
jgi:adenylate cyclase